MLLRKKRLVLLVALCLAQYTQADTESAVRVLNEYDQLVTSSTLLWVEARAGQIPEHTVSSGDAYVCRVRIDGMWVPGAFRNNECVTSMHAKVVREREPQVLQNVEGGGRLSWKHWDNSVVGAGAVFAGDDSKLMCVARRQPDLIGRIDRSLGLLGKVIVVEADGLEHEYKEGELLVETEPVAYELDDVVLQTWRARAHREPLTLGSAILRNDDPPPLEGDASAQQASRVDAVIAYDYNATVGWGHGHAILSGLPVTVRLRNGESEPSFLWGIDNTTTGLKATYPIEALLPPGTACNVTLRANWTESNVPYEGRLSALYKDGERRSRTLTGVKREVGLRDVRPHFGPVYYLADGTLVPTTSTTSTTSTAAPTTTSSSTARSTSTSSTVRPVEAPIPADTMLNKRPTTNNSTDMQADGPGAARDAAHGHNASSTPPQGIHMMTSLAAVVALIVCSLLTSST